MEELTIQRLEPNNLALQAAQSLFDNLTTAGVFSARKTLLFLSGGSCIEVATELLNLVPQNTSLQNLTVSLADERWVDAGSEDSNEQQLKQKNVLDQLARRGAAFISYLAVAEEPQVAAKTLSKMYEELFTENENVVLLAGVGQDGHTLGMLPDTNAANFFQNFSQPNLVTYYQLSNTQTNPHVQRITLTLTAVAKMTHIYIFAVGENKRDALNHLLKKDAVVNEVPALGLYLSEAVPQLYTDLEI
ncbi:MAG: 6-phosphogluconolactonase [Patescibacteria group bacterium]|nr:6-phosphogluconolactonase [Patescibacteria group bacterium]